MLKVSKEKYDSIHQDYKGIYHDYHGTHPEWLGKCVVMSTCITENPNEKCALLVENVHFQVTD